MNPMDICLASAIRDLDHWVQAKVEGEMENTWVYVFQEYIKSLTSDDRKTLIGYFIDTALRSQTIPTHLDKSMLIPIIIETENEFSTIFQQETVI